MKSTQNLRKLVMVNKRENQKTSKLILNHNALKFKINIEDAIKAQVLELKENSVEAKKLKAGARYECIYKNLLRDIRQFFSNNFEKFIQAELGKSYKTLQVRYSIFPVLILMFTNKFFDPVLITEMANKVGMERNEFLKQVAFTIGSFILPKYMIKCFVMNQQSGESSQKNSKSKISQVKIDVEICKLIQNI